MKRIILATSNNHKLKEFRNIFGGDVELTPLNGVNFTKEIVEDGSTFVENAMIKCREVYAEFKRPVLADDSGLCVDALDGGPGVLSARFGGKDMGSTDKCKLLLSKLEGVKDPGASFICALVLYINPNRFFVVQEEFRGKITFDMKGTKGFGYDPVFFLEEYGKTVAELDEDEKNRISHRGKASLVMKNIIKNLDF
jgi:XTP/dITP diphosphohydrolase